ncbi:MAG: hypothetical protein V4713_12340 [Pseudomonadota bacterium]
MTTSRHVDAALVVGRSARELLYENLDQVNLKLIAHNVDRMNAGVSTDEVANIVSADIAAFLKIGEGAYQRHAAGEMSDSINDHPAYKTEFIQASAHHPGLIKQISALNAITNSLVNTKEERKAKEYLVMRGDSEPQIALSHLMQLAPPAKDPVTTGLHIGRIMAFDGQMAGQKIGRDPDNMVWHDLGKLTGPSPRLGDHAEILYVDGKGRVKEQQQERSSNGVGR